MIFDFHTHIFPPEVIEDREGFARRDAAFGHLYGDPKARMVTAEGLLGAMAEEGVDRSLVCGFPWEDLGILAMTNRYLLDAQRSSDGRLVAFYTPSLTGAAEALGAAESGLASGMMGMGEVAFYVSRMDDSHWSYLGRLAGLAQEAGVPFLLHANETVGHVYPGKTDMRLKDLWRFVRDHPALTLVLAHWGGGFFFYELMKSVRPHVGRLYYDTAASPFLYDPQVYRVALEILGPDRILFGSDYPLIRPARYRQEMEAAGLPPEVQGRILGANAAALFP